jgi:hypothetical protein
MKAQWRTKYGNVKVKFKGRDFASKKEAKRYSELLELEAAGTLERLTLQPRFQLIEPQTDKFGNKYRGAHYTADFKYWDKEVKRWVVEDVKSYITRKKPDYVLRKKLFVMTYTNIEFREV